MKRNIFMFLSTALLVSLLSACGGVSAPTATPTPTETVSPEFTSGIVSATKFENSFLGLCYTLPDGWKFATQAEIDSLAGSGSELVESELNVSERPTSSTYYEFYAYDPVVGISSLVLVVENLTAHEGGKLITVKMFVDSLSEQYKSITSLDYSIGDSYRETIGNREFIVLPISIPELGLFQRNYVFRTGDYISSFTATAQSVEELDTIEANITAISQ